MFKVETVYVKLAFPVQIFSLKGIKVTSDSSTEQFFPVTVISGTKINVVAELAAKA